MNTLKSTVFEQDAIRLPDASVQAEGADWLSATLFCFDFSLANFLLTNFHWPIDNRLRSALSGPVQKHQASGRPAARTRLILVWPYLENGLSYSGNIFTRCVKPKPDSFPTSLAKIGPSVHKPLRYFLVHPVKSGFRIVEFSSLV